MCRFFAKMCTIYYVFLPLLFIEFCLVASGERKVVVDVSLPDVDAVVLVYLAENSAGIADCDAACWDIASDHTSCTDYRAFAYGYATANDYV